MSSVEKARRKAQMDSIDEGKSASETASGTTAGTALNEVQMGASFAAAHNAGSAFSEVKQDETTNEKSKESSDAEKNDSPFSFNETYQKKSVREVQTESLKEAIKSAGDVDVFKVVDAAEKVIDKDLTPKQFFGSFGSELKGVGSAYAGNVAANAVQAALDKTGEEGLKAINTKAFANKVVKSSSAIGLSVLQYLSGGKSEEMMLSDVSKSGAYDVITEVFKALGFDVNTLHGELPQGIRHAISPIVSYMAVGAVYKQVKDALKDEDISNSERARIEKTSREAVEQLIAIRKKMSDSVAEYLFTRLETVEESLTELDRALFLEDSDMFLKGNLKLQEMLGYDAPFRDQNEFDALMGSERPFRM